MILLKNIKIIDGTGAPASKGDILLKNGVISAIGSFPGKKADTVIDGLGLTATPGFIDAHSTSDHYLTLFTDPTQGNSLLQGVTTLIGGHCGSSLAPLLYGSLKAIRKWTDIRAMNVNWATMGELSDTLKDIGLGINFGSLVGHSTIRRDLIGDDVRDLTEQEMEVFMSMLSKNLDEGGLGFSTGLAYAHTKYVPYSEIKSLLHIVAKRGKVYSTHMREEKEGLLASVQETLRASEETGVPTIISHMRPMKGFETHYQKALRLIEESLGKSNVYFELNTFGTRVLPIYLLLPEWARQGSREAMLETLFDPRNREEAKKQIANSQNEFERMVIADAKGHEVITGKTLQEFAESRGVDSIEGIFLLMEITRMNTLLLYKNINEDLLAQSALHPRAIIGSNAPGLPLGGQAKAGSARAADTFPEFLKIALYHGAPIEDAIKKITYVPAQIYKLLKRGALKEGWAADLAILKDTQVLHTIVNGKFAVQDGALRNERAGLVL